MATKSPLITLLLFLFTFPLSAQSLQDLKAPLSFVIANDLGRNGYYRQKNIAELMGTTAEQTGPECIIAAGDYLMNVDQAGLNKNNDYEDKPLRR